MVLIRCCPAWFSAALVSPQPFGLTGQPDRLATLVYYSILFDGVLIDLFGADYPAHRPRTEVNWVYWSYRLQQRFYLKSFVDRVLTCSDLWSSADWFERELWEMFGVLVGYHFDLRRLITDYGFVGFPLRKEFPVTGYVEVRYSEAAHRVVSRPAVFTQEFRLFDFKTAWLN